MNPLHQSIADLFQCHNLIQVVCSDRHICNLTCNLCSVADGNSYICCRQRRRVIDSISDHDDLRAVCLRFFDKMRLVFRQHFGEIPVHTYPRSDGTCSTVTVACHHNHIFNTDFLQFLNDFCSLFPKRILDTDHSTKFSIHCQV